MVIARSTDIQTLNHLFRLETEAKLTNFGLTVE